MLSVNEPHVDSRNLFSNANPGCIMKCFSKETMSAVTDGSLPQKLKDNAIKFNDSATGFSNKFKLGVPMTFAYQHNPFADKLKFVHHFLRRDLDVPSTLRIMLVKTFMVIVFFTFPLFALELINLI